MMSSLSVVAMLEQKLPLLQLDPARKQPSSLPQRPILVYALVTLPSAALEKAR